MMSGLTPKRTARKFEMKSVESVDIGIVGAGPYGISLGLSLKALGADFRIFGPPMDTWRNHMPRGMHLKSEGYASTIWDPAGPDLESFCRERSLDYGRHSVPVPLETFCSYGLATYERLADVADPQYVAVLAGEPSGFKLVSENGQQTHVKRIVLAVGIHHYAYLPEEFSNLPCELVTHSSAHPDPSKLAGKKVLLVGSGASGIDLATLLAESGCNATLVTRSAEIGFSRLSSPDDRTLLQRIRRPNSCMGPGMKGYVYEHAPYLFRQFPEETRFKIFKSYAGPCGGWFVEQAFQANVRSIVDSAVTNVKLQGDGLRIAMTSSAGSIIEEEFDHLIFATGYKPDVKRLSFLDQRIRDEIRATRGAPVLSANYESSVPGVYFVGLSSAPTFGPLMRFVCGTGYASKAVSRHLTGKATSK
jgi:thioredoxin reductase